ncbi:MAG: type II toxin-antitoxin system RelE/ParE family toxin [Promethearchaeota archaeon]
MSIQWTEPAIASLQAIKNFISLDSKYYGQVFVERIIQQVEKLKLFPEVGRIVPEYKQKNIREIIFGNYRIVYHFYRKSIVVLNIIHAYRDFSNVIKKKFINKNKEVQV